MGWIGRCCSGDVSLHPPQLQNDAARRGRRVGRRLERLGERTAKSDQNGYPPYNIEQTSDTSFRITLAVAGFGEDDLSITVEDRQLIVRGQSPADEEERLFLHRGIAARQFQRSFVLAEGVEVAGANSENGLLHVDLKRSVPEKIVTTIKIGKGA